MELGLFHHTRAHAYTPAVNMMFMPVTKSPISKDKPGDKQLKRRASMAGTSSSSSGKRESIFDSYKCTPPGSSSSIMDGELSRGMKQLQQRKQSLEASRRSSSADLRRDLALSGISLDNSLDKSDKAPSAASKKLRDVVRRKIIPANMFKSAVTRQSLPKTVEEEAGSSNRTDLQPSPSQTNHSNKTNTNLSTGGTQKPPGKDGSGTSGALRSIMQGASQDGSNKTGRDKRDDADRERSSTGQKILRRESTTKNDHSRSTRDDSPSTKRHSGASHKSDDVPTGATDSSKARPKLQRNKSSIDKSEMEAISDKKERRRWKQAIAKVREQKFVKTKPQETATLSETVANLNRDKNENKKDECISSHGDNGEKSTKPDKVSRPEKEQKPEKIPKPKTDIAHDKEKIRSTTATPQSMLVEESNVVFSPQDKKLHKTLSQNLPEKMEIKSEQNCDRNVVHNEPEYSVSQRSESCASQQKEGSASQQSGTGVHQTQSSANEVKHSKCDVICPPSRRSMAGPIHRVIPMGVPQSMSHPEMARVSRVDGSSRSQAQSQHIPASFSDPKMSQAVALPPHLVQHQHVHQPFFSYSDSPSQPARVPPGGAFSHAQQNVMPSSQSFPQAQHRPTSNERQSQSQSCIFPDGHTPAGQNYQPGIGYSYVPQAVNVLQSTTATTTTQAIYQNVNYHMLGHTSNSPNPYPRSGPPPEHITPYANQSAANLSDYHLTESNPTGSYQHEVRTSSQDTLKGLHPPVIYSNYYYGQQYGYVPSQYMYHQTPSASRDAANSIKNDLSKYMVSQPSTVPMAPYYINMTGYTPYMYDPSKIYPGYGPQTPAMDAKHITMRDSHTYVNISNFHSQMPPNDLTNFLKSTVQKRDPSTRHRKIIPKGGKCTCKNRSKKLDKQAAATAEVKANKKSSLKNEKNHNKALVSIKRNI